MFKNYDPTCKAIFFGYTSLHIFDVAAASAVRWLQLQNDALSIQKIFAFRPE